MSESSPIPRQPIRLERLRQEHKTNPPIIYDSEILSVQGLPERYTVYNPTMVSSSVGSQTLLGRVEHEDNERSDVWALHRIGNTWMPNGLRIEGLQDPHLKKIAIDGEEFFLFDGVRVGEHPKYRSVGECYYMLYWCVKNLCDIPKTEPFAYTPPWYKDTPIERCKNGPFMVFPRPQGGRWGRGSVCYEEFDRLDQLSDAIEGATPIQDLKQLFDGETVWGGFKDAFQLANDDLIGLGGHVSHYSTLENPEEVVREGPLRVYDVASAVYNRKTGLIEGMWIDLTTKDLPECEMKILPNYHPENLRRVVFGTVWDRLGNGRVRILGGLRDRYMFEVVKEDWFERFEKTA